MSLESIAIIGMSCRFPGAKNLEAYWQLLSQGKIAVSDVPSSRWDADDYYHAPPGTSGKIYTRRGGFLEQIDQFDADFFGISRSEIQQMDPQQRLLLEVVWEALENAVIVPSTLTQSRSGVFVGIGTYDYNRLLSQKPEQLSAYAGPGTSLSIAANRISHVLNLQGPSLSIDTACSSSLVALHYACQSLLAHESNLCLVGGVNALLSPESSVAFAQAQMLSASGRCQPFEAGADGYVRSEGCGVVVLKRLRDALEEGDRIQAVIRGSAVNHNGLTSGLTAPNGPAQQAVIRQALKAANVQPTDINYVETHAVGTAIGDAIEVSALKAVLTENRESTQSCWLGTHKPNLGHLEAAAGMASLIKVVLSLQHQQVLPHPTLETLHPYIKLEQTPLSIPTQSQPWPANSQPRLAGVSGFGFGGANAHVVIEESPESRSDLISDANVSSPEQPLHLLTLSAKGEQALQDLGKRYQAFLQIAKNESLSDICFSANAGRAHFKYRLALVAASVEQFIQQLQAFEQGQENAGLYCGPLSCKATPYSQTHGKANTNLSTKADGENKIDLETIAQQYVQGESIDWAKLYQDQPGQKIALPTYPWQRQRYWCEQASAQATLLNPQPAKPVTSTSITSTLRQQTAPSAQATDLIEWLRDYANKRINSRLMDERRCIPPHIVLDFGDRGLFGLQVPPEYGGLGLSTQDTLRVIEQLGAIDQTLTLLVGNHNALGIRPIMNWATERVRQQLLPQLATGRKLGAFALTEPEAGSNPRALAARAIAQSDGSWQLEGTKIWSGSAAWAGAVNVFVQHFDAQGKSQGISGFVVPQGSQGLRQGPEALTMGMRGMVQNTVFLEGVPVQAKQLLGEAGNGMAVAQDAMMQGRLGLAAGCLGGMKRCAQLMLRYGSRRTVASGLLLDNAVTQVRLTGLTRAIAALETLVFTVAELIDHGIAVPEEAYIACKTIGPEFFWQAADQLVQLMGGRGYIETNIAPQILRDARVFRIFEGPTETLNMFLGSRIVNQSDPLFHFLTDTLGAPELAQRLQQATEKIQAQSQQSQLSQRMARQWAYASIGEVASLAIVMATVQVAYGRARTPDLAQTLEWCAHQFKQKLDTLLAHEPAVHIYASANTLTHKITNYAESIGDITQQSAGEHPQLDEYLQKSVSQAPSVLVPSLPIQSSAVQSFDLIPSPPVTSKPPTMAQPLVTQSVVHTAEQIQTWIGHWMAKALGIDTAIDRTISFADYGMDSVLGIELVHDLEDWLQQSLDVTALWNFPTIETLGNHLAESATPPDNVVSSGALDHHASETTLSTNISQELLALERLLES